MSISNKFFKIVTVFISLIAPNITIHASDIREERTISKVEKIEIVSPIGTVPVLPFQIWVQYSNGDAEYRQVEWSNYSINKELLQADTNKYPLGSQYEIKGYIVGDESTPNGFPLLAKIIVSDKEPQVPSNEPLAEVVPLDQVRIEGDNRLTWNRDLAIKEIVSWDVSQQLYNYRDSYGLSTEGYTVSDGWDSPTTKLKGHGSGHYMSSLAFAFVSTDNVEYKNILRSNMKRMVDELRACQEMTFVWNDELGRYWEARDFAPEDELKNLKGSWDDFDIYKKHPEKYGYGYINAIPAQHPALIEMYRAYNNTDWVWAPYYSIHKQLAGLIDIATYVDDKSIAQKALLIAKDMGLWIWNRLSYRTFVKKDGTKEERRSKPGNRYEMWNIYIAGEDGGTGESLARLSEMVSDTLEKARLLEASNYFDSPAFYDPLSKNIDDIRNRHANQHIPKIISALRSYRGNANPYYYHIAQNFWTLIQGRYRYATGGVGNVEMFREPYSQILSMSTNGATERNKSSNPTLNETCCAYNLAKLTKDLNCFNPDDAKYMDYYERVLYNQIVGSLNHEHYSTTYQYAVGLNASKPFGNTTPQSTCCGGTGSENHVKYQEALYFKSDDILWVGLYMPSTMNWKEKNVVLKQDCEWPAEYSKINIVGEASFALKLRVPYWATNGFDVKLNGKSVSSEYKPSSYVEIPLRKWNDKDIVEIYMPFSKHIDYAPDKLEVIPQNDANGTLEAKWVGALMYGPLVMTATDITKWEEATINIDQNLTTIVENGVSTLKNGPLGNLYSLSQSGKLLLPDYYRHNNSTHYFRINYLSDPSKEYKKVLETKVAELKAFIPSNYTKKSFRLLDVSIKNAKDLLMKEIITHQQLTIVLEDLDKSVNSLIAKKLNKDKLRNAISIAKSKDGKSFTWDSYNNVKTELLSSENIIVTSNDQKEVDLQFLHLTNAISNLKTVESVDKSALKELIVIANSRIKSQEDWNKMENKVPDYSPWAKFGYRRLLHQAKMADNIVNNTDKNYNQIEVDEAMSNLNSAINTMRPGNLPEFEDLYGLIRILKIVKEKAEGHESKYSEAIDYGEMVVRYVEDGSGTQDMIDNAIKTLKASIGE